MTTDPIEPGEPGEPREPDDARPARPARGPHDPFERAARREEQEELRREITRAKLLSRVTPRRDSGMGAALVVFAVPYAIWALIRAAFYDFGEPTLPRSIVEFLFGEWWWFGAYTGWVLFLVWVALIQRFSGGDD
jgi:hypothetical protein